MPDHILALVIGFVLDLLLGDPTWIYHPVCIIGKYISFAEKKLRARGGNLRRSADPDSIDRAVDDGGCGADPLGVEPAWTCAASDCDGAA